jgi:tight adherence protein C
MILVLAGIALFVGCTLLLAEVRWFSRRPLTVRLAPYVPGGATEPTRQGVLSVGSFREAVGPVARALGGRFSRLFGIVEDLDRRLARVHSDLDVTAFRIRQIGWSIAGFGGGAALAVATRPPAPLAVVFTFGGLLLAFLLLEQQVTVASDRWKRAVRNELPVVAEQLGMLLTSGYSLVAALDRVARRGHGTVARDLSRTLVRVRQGVPTERALREWADLADVDAVGRLVAVLAMNREASDLGRLIANEARAIRRDVQRDLIVTIERRGQQVWIPVTVAALVPGAIFIGIPFTAALRGFLG